MFQHQHRCAVLQSFGATAPVDALLSYTERTFDDGWLCSPPHLPLAAEPHIRTWQDYAERAARADLFTVLQEELIQLHFPVQAGISRTKTYLEATCTGALPPPLPWGGLQLQKPQDLKLWIHPTAAGPLPVLLPATRCDFVALVQALTKKNEPVPIAEAVGACIVSGYNNWGREAAWKRRLLADGRHWPAHFAEFREDRALYQDRFMILSRGPYSNVAADALGLDEEYWDNVSLQIRLAHECAHYLTYRLLGSMRNHLFDELLADYAGIVAGCGRYRADWFLHFLGLESLPTYRPGGRFEHYLKQVALGPNERSVLQRLLQRAADHLEVLDQHYRMCLDGPWATARMLLALSCMGLEELASAQYRRSFEHNLVRVLRTIK